MNIFKELLILERDDTLLRVNEDNIAKETRREVSSFQVIDLLFYLKIAYNQNYKITDLSLNYDIIEWINKNLYFTNNDRYKLVTYIEYKS